MFLSLSLSILLSICHSISLSIEGGKVREGGIDEQSDTYGIITGKKALCVCSMLPKSSVKSNKGVGK